MQFERREMFMNKIQALANEMKQFFSPQTVTNVYSICEQLEIEIVEALIQADAYFECENGNRKEIFMSKIPTYTERRLRSMTLNLIESLYCYLKALRNELKHSQVNP